MSGSPEVTPRPSAGAGGSGAGEPGAEADGGTGVPPDLRVAAAFAADLVAVVVFVLLGRSSHGEDEALRGVLITLWPFLSGLVIGWLGLLLTHLRPGGYGAGLLLVASTVAVGMVLRHTVSHDGTPVSFVIAASTFLILLHLGWRAAARLIGRRRGA